MMQNRLKALILLLPALCALAPTGCARREETVDPAQLIAAAWTDYTLAEFDRATTKFEAALTRCETGSDLQLQALYGLATTWNLRRPGEDTAKATKLYRHIVDSAPAHDLAAWSALALARMKHLVPIGDDPDYRDVRKAYREVMDRYPGHLAAKEAFIYFNATLVSSLDMNEAQEALGQLKEFVKDPATEFLGTAYSLMAVAYTTLGDQDQRLAMEIRSLENTEVDPTNPFTEFSWQYWNIATIAEFEVGDFETARTYYQKLIAEYPNDIRKYGAKQALERMNALEEKIRKEL
jgi:tetratricopeptide (TPR) repeat protein